MQLMQLYFFISRQVLHFCMYNFVFGNEANRALLPETTLHIQKYDGFENIDKPNRALKVTLSSSTDTNLGHNQNQNLKKRIVEIYVFRIAFSREVVGH